MPNDLRERTGVSINGEFTHLASSQMHNDQTNLVSSHMPNDLREQTCVTLDRDVANLWSSQPPNDFRNVVSSQMSDDQLTHAQ